MVCSRLKKEKGRESNFLSFSSLKRKEDRIILKFKEYQERLEALRIKTACVRATFYQRFHDKKHLDKFWYDGLDIATIKYKSYTIHFNVAGSFSFVLYKRGKFKSVFTHEDETASFYGNTECMRTIRNDKALYNPDKIDFDNRNYIYVEITNKSGYIISELEKLEENSLLEAVENHFNHCIEQIENLEEKENEIH